jgi:hypothetical protein
MYITKLVCVLNQLIYLTKYDIIECVRSAFSNISKVEYRMSISALSAFATVAPAIMIILGYVAIKEDGLVTLISTIFALIMFGLTVYFSVEFYSTCENTGGRFFMGVYLFCMFWVGIGAAAAASPSSANNA